MTETYPNLLKYLLGRNEFRSEASTTFFKREGVNDLLCLLGEYVVEDMFLLSGRDLRGIPNGIYIARLMVSFTRTHFIAADCVTAGELVEATTLIRKQAELLARLNELQHADIDKLQGKTPNVRSLRSGLKSAYGVYSEIAHSSKFEPLELLGTVDTPEGMGSALFPVCEEHAYVTLSHLALTVFELFMWRSPWMSLHFSDYNSKRAEHLFTRAVSAYKHLTDEIDNQRRQSAPPAT